MKNIIILSALILSLASCKNLVPYTDSMRQQYNWSESQVRKIQFYVSRDIVLQRELTGGSTEIVSGKIKTVNGRKVDQIIIRQGTPGVLTQIPREGKMLVSFEKGDDHFLSFGVNPNMDGKYFLLASEWNNGIGKVTYVNRSYYSEPDSRYAHLLVDLRKLLKEERSVRVAKGRKVK